MLRSASPLVLIAALAAGQARAQDGDRYGPRPAPYAVPASAPVGDARGGYAPALRPAPPLLRSLSWPGKAELRPALAPADAAARPAAPSAASYALRSAPSPGTGRFPGMAAYAAAPALRPEATPYARVAPSSTDRPTPARRDARPFRRANAPSFQPAQPVYIPPSAEALPPGGRAQAGGSNLPTGLATPPAYVPPGPAYGPALAAQARDQARAAAAATADTLPPPTVGRYGYVGPGRTVPAAVPNTAAAAYPTAAATAATGGMGPPRPPAYARSYVLASQPMAAGPGAPPASAPAADGRTAARTVDGVRRYSVHREYGMEPDPLPVPPQFFAATPDLSAPETEPPAPRTSKAAVNAARLAASGG